VARAARHSTPAAGVACYTFPATVDRCLPPQLHDCWQAPGRFDRSMQPCCLRT
jgi:hypothetical protein